MRTIVVSAFIFFGCVFSTVQAQSYKVIKQNYDHRMYVPSYDDPYNTTVMGLTSFFMPGLGQILCGETGRGLAFMGGAMGVGLGVGITMLAGLSTEPSDNVLGLSPAEAVVALTGSAIWIGMGLWASTDAMKIAKVKNMYFQDMRGNTSSVKVELNPFFDTNNYLGQTNASAGLSLKVTF